MLSKIQAALPLLITLFSVAGCGAEKSKDDQAADFYEEKLNSQAKKDCNGKGYAYNALGETCYDETSGDKMLKLAAWACTREELTNQTTAADAADLTKLDQKIGDGYEMYQCGTTKEGIIVVIIIKKAIQGDNATIQQEALTFIGNAAGTDKQTVTDTQTNTDPQTETTTHLLKVNDGVALPAVGAGVCSPLKFSYFEATAANPNGEAAASPESFYITLSSSDNYSGGIFLDSSCSEAELPEFPKGAKDYTVYYVLTTPATVTFTATIPGAFEVKLEDFAVTAN